jgi:hypothetical protein
MQQIPDFISSNKIQGLERGRGDIPSISGRFTGGRIASKKMRQAQEFCDEFCGLDIGINRYELLRLVKRLGRSGGFSPRMIELLDYYMAFTREIDWGEGGRPIVYQSLSKTALDLGVSERQIQKLEKLLFEQGALTWNDSGNHRRYGQRDEKTGMILYAYGVDLTPLAALKNNLEAKLLQKEEHDRTWMETKRQISWYRRQIKGMIGEIQMREGEGSFDIKGFELEQGYLDIAIQIRTHIDLEALQKLLQSHKVLHTRALNIVSDITSSFSEKSLKTQKCSSRSDQRVAHYNYTTYKKSDKSDTSRTNPFNSLQGGVAAFSEDQTVPQELNSTKDQESRGLSQDNYPQYQPSQRVDIGIKVSNQANSGQIALNPAETLILSTGLQHITLKQALNAASSRFKVYIPVAPRPMGWNDIIEAAYALKKELHISQQSWADACVTLGRSGAAVCVMLTDQACMREISPVVKPAAYFHAMINKAKKGDLHLHNSIFGILKRDLEIHS